MNVAPFPPTEAVTLETLRQYTPEQLASRPILHPDYAGYEADFNWRDYISVELSPTNGAELFSQALDQIATTPEGQQLIRQANAGDAWKASNYNRIDDKLTLNNGIENRYNIASGGVEFNLYNITHQEYETIAGEWHDASIQRVLVHELLHAADPLSFQPHSAPHSSNVAVRYILEQLPEDVTSNLSPLPLYWPPNVLKQLQAIVEEPAINTANQFMQTYYDENAHRKDHTGWRYEAEGTSEITTQKNLDADHSYDEIQTPDVPDIRDPEERKR